MKLQLCGSVGLLDEHDANPDRVLPAKALAMLAFLAMEPKAHSRESLRALLWGEVSEQRSQASLRQALARLRAVLGDWMVIERSTVALRPGLPCDVTTFVERADANDEAAADIDIAEFLVALDVRTCRGYDEWATRTRLALLKRWRVAIRGAVKSAQARREWSRAVVYARRAYAVDGFSDEAAHLVVESLHLSGDSHAALHSLQQHRLRLKTERGAAVGMALRAFGLRIQHGAPSAIRPAASERPPLSNIHRGPLTDRVLQWDVLVEAWAASAAPTASVVLIEGSAGTGKTRLLEDFGRWCTSEGAAVVRAVSLESESLPFGAARRFLRAVIELPGIAGTDPQWLTELSRVLPEIRQKFPQLPMPASTGDTSVWASLVPESAAEVLLAAAENAPLVIMVDDLHRLDGESAQLLQMLIERLASAHVLWCFTDTPGHAERGAPAARLGRELHVDRAYRHLRVEPFSAETVWTLLSVNGGLDVPDEGRALATSVHALTGGNAAHVVAIIDALFQFHWLRKHPVSGRWTTTEHTGAHESHKRLSLAMLLPDAFAQIATRVARLPDEPHALLLTIAIAGRNCHPSLLSYVHGISRLRAAHICDALLAARLINEEPTGYHCADHVIGEAIREDMSPFRRREVHRMIGLALTDAALSVRQTVDPSLIAWHMARADEKDATDQGRDWTEMEDRQWASRWLRQADVDITAGA